MPDLYSQKIYMALYSETKIWLMPVLHISTTKEPPNENLRSFQNFVDFILCLSPSMFSHNIFSQENSLGNKVQIVVKSIHSR